MGRPAGRATVVLCASLPRSPGRGACEAWLSAAVRTRVPLTWAADIDTLAAIAAASDARGIAPPALALSLEPAWLDSRSTLRRMIASARRLAAGIDAAVLRGPRPLAHHALLAEEGIGVVLVDGLVESSRVSRRPAPSGWRCRNPVWGLWEVQADPPRRPGVVGWLLAASSPRPRPGGLQVLHAGDVQAERPVGGRLERWLAWVERGQASGRMRAVGLADLPALVARGGQAPVSGSILKAA